MSSARRGRAAGRRPHRDFGDRGINLSRGQRALVALARAVYADADVYLLDYPNMLDEFYVNLVDWGCHNKVTVSLDKSVHLSDHNNGGIAELISLPGHADGVTSVRFSADGAVLAIRTNRNNFRLWDVQPMSEVRKMRGHRSRPGSLAWNGATITSGARDDANHNHDVRVSSHPKFVGCNGLRPETNGHLGATTM